MRGWSRCSGLRRKSSRSNKPATHDIYFPCPIEHKIATYISWFRTGYLPNFNVTFYTKLLVAADELLAAANSKVKQKAFKDLADLDTLGIANNCKRGTGIGLMFLGAAVAVTTGIADGIGYLNAVAGDRAHYVRMAGYGSGGLSFFSG